MFGVDYFVLCVPLSPTALQDSIRGDLLSWARRLTGTNTGAWLSQSDSLPRDGQQEWEGPSESSRGSEFERAHNVRAAMTRMGRGSSLTDGGKQMHADK